jgi:hypothetical protein
MRYGYIFKLQDTAMKNLSLCCVAISLALSNLSGCASTRAQTPGAQSPPSAPVSDIPTIGTESCFWIRDVRHWDVIDPSTLIVYAPMPKEAYLVKLLQPIPDLRFHLTLGFEDTDHMGRVCRIGTFVSVGQPMPWRAPVAAVRALTPDEVKQVKTAAKTKGKGTVATPATGTPANTG